MEADVVEVLLIIISIFEVYTVDVRTLIRILNYERTKKNYNINCYEY